ncbi:MAG: alpha/beta fold hydrolase [Halieaceae bacterium]|nr:alpha/beta fold hydrolase [Halieaceae bacterium]
MKSRQWTEHTFDLGDFELVSGQILKDAELRYFQIGALNAPKNNLVILPTYYGGTAQGVMPWVDHADSPVDPNRYCIVIPCLFGAGQSSSPSCAHTTQTGANFPEIDIADNVHAQRHLVERVFDNAEVRLVMGWSMGGLQALHWAALYPDLIKRAIAVCATAKCYPHNQLFLDSVITALATDPVFSDGHYSQIPKAGLVAFARVYLTWAYSQAFFRDGLYRKLGFDSIQDLKSFWEEDHLQQDANDLVAVANTWRHADVYRYLDSQHLQVPTLMMPSSTDLYFTEADAKNDSQILGTDLQVIDSAFGHIAGGPGRLQPETQQIFRAVQDALLG